jgi:hypothetical protein
MCAAQFGHGKKSSHDGNESYDMKDQDHDLQLRKEVGHEDIDEHSNSNYCECKERALPLHCIVFRVIEFDYVLNHGSRE